MADGFQPPDLADAISVVADRFGVSQTEIRDDLMTHKRYTHLRGDDRRTYATTDRMHAESYASRAQEVEWECLWAVYRLQHPNLGDDWNQSDSGHLWVTARQAEDPPVVLELAVPLSSFPGVDRPRLLETLQIARLTSVHGGVEVVIPADATVEVVARFDADRWVDGSLLSFMSGLPDMDIAAEVDAGLWGPPVLYKGSRSWRWRDVLSRLPPHRRYELGLNG